ncbi:nickel pincer cofactor biosynthesis protein LarB [Desulfoferrobacter suflitae]|uniref:nickel pincer cofactor biosynthesis protein LarB n=1 Tax=Desulfoferrobacter suflitae TaxID=2865782 RepID=UPI0021640060|nr:nickel pincer cofactor biosynthesis protein LarB [Desulfoferrobacter suflitae]MCK8603389.1 nickel pincer cofactor biosynthesis protein LarB [Desulfoferrobacter suflitae]
MDSSLLRILLEDLQKGELDIDSALRKLKTLPFEDLGYARIDSHRCLRTGVSEVVLCAGKTIEQIVGIAQRIAQNHRNILLTRASKEVFTAVEAAIDSCQYHATARIIVVNPTRLNRLGKIAVVSAGTSDMPVAEEAAVTAETLGSDVDRFYDVGVAGIHRLLHVCDDLMKANAAVVAAGMEGALASVVGGLVACPVIGVPTSVGYGASFGGLAALLGMLNSCAPGVSVVNIDNGFGAGYQAHLINKAVCCASS